MHPAHVVVDSGNRLAYTTISADNSVIIVDIDRREAWIRSPPARSRMACVRAPNGREVYVAGVDDNTVSVIDRQTAREVARIPVGRARRDADHRSRGHGVVTSGDGDRVFISNSFTNVVSVINVASQRVVESVGVGQEPGGITYLAPE